MFEEYLTRTWICPCCGEVSNVRVKEFKDRNFKRNTLKVFEYSGGINTRMEVHCAVCGSECYME